MMSAKIVLKANPALGVELHAERSDAGYTYFVLTFARDTKRALSRRKFSSRATADRFYNRALSSKASATQGLARRIRHDPAATVYVFKRK